MRRIYNTFAKESPTRQVSFTPHVRLTKWESQIFRFLRRVAAITSTTTNSVELRVAGGWVRDKLLKRPTGDIDIAVRHITGFQFASRLHSFATARTGQGQLSRDTTTSGEVSKAQEDSFTHSNDLTQTMVGCAEYVPDISTVALIVPSPATSRHLETATVRLDGVDLDFVQLRTEDYAMSAGNRIPSNISAGTPQQDSVRRDFTVNALYYNIHTGIVEDFTGQGLGDLKRALLRTPLESRTTLLEDPLRAMRAIRFACTLNFQLHPSLCDALSSAKVRANLSRKVSRERIGSEIMQIIESNDVIEGLELIARHGLHNVVFMDTFKSLADSSDTEFLAGVERVRSALRTQDSYKDWIEREQSNNVRGYGRKVLILAVLLYHTSRVQTALHEAIRRRKSLQQDVRRVILLSGHLEEAVRRWYLVRSVPEEYMREEALWTEIAKIVRESGESLWVAVVISASVRSGNAALLHDILEAGISSRVCRVTYAVDGKRLQKELGIRPGPEVGQALGELMHIQLRSLRKGRNETHSLSRGERIPSNAEEYLQLLKASRMRRELARN